jgi:hypothetical protein
MIAKILYTKSQGVHIYRKIVLNFDLLKCIVDASYCVPAA